MVCVTGTSLACIAIHSTFYRFSFTFQSILGHFSDSFEASSRTGALLMGPEFLYDRAVIESMLQANVSCLVQAKFRR